MHDPQLAVYRDGHVVGADQLPDSRGIDCRHAAQVHDDGSIAGAKQRSKRMPQFCRERRAKRAIDIEDGPVRRVASDGPDRHAGSILHDPKKREVN